MGLYTTVMDPITYHTGLSPAAFFTIAAVMFVVYKTVCGMFVDPEDYDDKSNKTSPKPVNVETSSSDSTMISEPAEPVQLGDVTEQELRAYDGSDPKKPLLMAIKGQIYDVSRSRMFYGPRGPYALFAGRDASRALALLSFNAEDLTGNIEGLSESELEVLQDWEYKFMEKYVKVGQLITEKTAKNTGNGDKMHERQNQGGAETQQKL